jgi:hypothetical protein
MKPRTFEPVHVGHVQVEHHQLNRAYGQPLDGFQTRAGLDKVALALKGCQRRANHPPDRRRVVDNEQLIHELGSAEKAT